MKLQQRIHLLSELGQYILSSDEQWQQEKEKASHENSWFKPEFVDLAANNIANQFLQKNILEKWVTNYKLKTTKDKPAIVGIVMAGNIPLVGFHDLLSVFISGHRAVIKPSSKDEILIKHLVKKMNEWDSETGDLIQFSDMLKGCDAYIATGSNNSSRYFEYYFAKYPHIIRRNRTSVAILSGSETKEEFEKLADDVFLFFGLGCRNVTKIYVPENYNFVPLLETLKKYESLADHHKYKSNYDYNLALHILNKKYYMTNGSILLVEDKSHFSPIAQLNYEFYGDKNTIETTLSSDQELQYIVGQGHLLFGMAQCPRINDYADGVDTLSFLMKL
jgi:hypothetical protein